MEQFNFLDYKASALSSTERQNTKAIEDRILNAEGQQERESSPTKQQMINSYFHCQISRSQ